MTTNQTIDGVPREVLEQALLDAQQIRFPEDKQIVELRALLDAPVNPLSEIEVLRAAVKELEALRDTRVDAKLAQPQGEPVKTPEMPYKMLPLEEDGWFQCVNAYEAMYPLYAEQPAPVAVVLPERMSLEKPEHHTAPVEIHNGVVTGWNACLDEVTRLNTKE